MTQRTKLDLPINQPTEITLLYSEPITGKSQYGDYYMYAVSKDDTEFSYFAPAEVHSELSKLSKGEKAIITKLAAQRGSKLITTYDVKLISANVKQQIELTTEYNTEKEDIAPTHDSFFGIMLNSYRDALKISKELNGMADPEKIAVTLFIARSKQINY
jgi:hypothetical protein